MSYFKKFVSTLVAALVLILEVILIKFYHETACMHCVVICATIFIFILLLVLFFTGKDSNILISFLVPLHNHTGNIAGIFMILFILVQVHLIGTELHEFICCHGNIWTICIYFMVLLLPFLIQSLFYDNRKRKILKPERKVLIIAVSDNPLSKLEEISKDYFDNKSFNDFIEIQQFKYKALLKTLKEYENINNIIFLLDKKAGSALDEFKKKNSNDFILELLDLCFPERFDETSFEYVPLNDINNFTEMYKEIKPIIEHKISSYEDRQVLFNISAGPSTISAALVLFSVIGERGFCYLEQVDFSQDKFAKILEFEINAFDLKELWNEILTIVRIKE